MTIAVRYEYAQGSAEQRDQQRPKHVAFLDELHRSGVLVVSGRLEDARRPGALLVLDVDDADEAVRRLDADPFWTAGVVAERDVRSWNIAFGAERVRS